MVIYFRLCENTGANRLRMLDTSAQTLTSANVSVVLFAMPTDSQGHRDINRG